MTNMIKNIRTAVFVLLGIGLVLVAEQTYMISALFEVEVYHYEYGNILPDIFNYVLVAVVVAAIAMPFIFTRKKSLHTTMGRESTVTVVFAALVAFFVLWVGLATLYDVVMESKDVLVATQSRTRSFRVLQAILSLPMFAYFVLTAFSVEKHVGAKTILGILAIVWHIIFLLVLYFDTAIPLNCPLRYMFQFAVVASMMYLVYEIRFLLGISKSKLYVAISCISATLCAVASLPVIITGITGKLALSSFDYCCCGMLAVMTGYIVSRIITYLKECENNPAKEGAEELVKE